MTAQNITPLNREPSFAVTTIAPEMAERMLGKNTTNRNIRLSAVRSYARDMAAGNWHLNGETIKFAADGTLLDGQHRLHAVIASGATVQMLVARGVRPEAMRTVDMGLRRRYADHLKINGFSNAPTLASLVRRAVMWEEGKYLNTGTVQPTAAEMDAFLEACPEIAYSAEIASKLSSRNLLPASVIGLAHWLFSDIDPDQATWFIGRVVDEDVEVDHPARVLNRRIVSMRIAGGRVNESEALALTIRAWNAYRAGETPKKFQMPKGGLTNSNFPEPR